ncbi:type IV secretion system protein VirB7 [Burkholderia latens]
MRTLVAFLLCALLGACASVPKDLRIPDDSKRTPINRTIPPEVQNGAVN